MKVQKDAICNRCNIEIEDIIHLFHTCKHSKEIWKIATYYINEIINYLETYITEVGKLLEKKSHIFKKSGQKWAELQLPFWESIGNNMSNRLCQLHWDFNCIGRMI